MKGSRLEQRAKRGACGGRETQTSVNGSSALRHTMLLLRRSCTIAKVPSCLHRVAARLMSRPSDVSHLVQSRGVVALPL